jgi:hypothetical protein
MAGRPIRERTMSTSGLQSVATMADLQEIDGNRSSAATQKLGNTASSVKDEHKVGSNADTDGVLSMQELFDRMMIRQEEQARQIAALVANTLPPPTGISASSGSVVRSGGSLGAAMRSQLAAPAKNVTPRTVTITPSSDEKSGASAHATSSAITLDGDDEDGLVDVGMDGNQDEPTAAEQATALASRLASGQCAYVDDEHEGSFVTWFKSISGWKESFKREVKLMCTIADKMRDEFNIETSESFEMVCCRIAALQCLNEGDGSAVADIIEQKHHKSMVPQVVRLAAIKQANMVNRTKVINKGSGDKKKPKRTKSGLYHGVTKNASGPYAGKAGGATGAKK